MRYNMRIAVPDSNDQIAEKHFVRRKLIHI